MSRSASRSAAIRAAIALLIAAGGVTAEDAAASSRWTAVLEIGGEPAATRQPVIADNYSGAMAEYRMLRSQQAAANHLAGRLTAPGAKRWRWRAEDGSTVQRIGEGVFRLTGRDCLSALCTEVDCFAADWPNFQCTDGRSRRMSAPDLATVVFDGVTYTRSLPPPSEDLFDDEVEEIDEAAE